MRTKPLLTGGIAAAALALTLTGCSMSSPSDAGSGSTSHTTASSTKLTGSFDGTNGKKVAGTVTITGDKIELSGFSSDQGPDLHLYLTDGTAESDVTGGVEIGMVSYNTASQTFTVPSGVDPSKYTDLVEHCDKALAVFGAAPLSK